MFVHCNGPTLPKCENTEKSRTDGAFMIKQCLYYGIQRRNTFRTWFCNIQHVFPVKITFYTLFSLLQIIRRFLATYSAKSQTKAIFMGKL